MPSSRARWALNRPGFVALGLLVATLGGCDLVSPSSGDEARDDLASARAMWAAAGIASYELTVERFCYCGFVGPVRLTVVNGLTTSVVPEEEIPDEPGLLLGYPDVTGLFAVVDEALDLRAHRLRVAYHPTLGYPTEISIDYDESAQDDEIGYTASLKVLRDEG